MLRFGRALCVALAVGGCRAGTLEVGSPGGPVSAGDAAAAVAGGGDGGGGGTAGPVDAASSGRLDGGVADVGTSSAAGACVPLDPTALRLWSPQSGSIVTSAAPRFRWTGGRHPYRLQVCADRACDDVVVEVRSAGTEATLPQDLPAGYWFWRVQATPPDGVPPTWTSAWEMRVRRRFPGYGPTANTSVGGFSDYNGDGYPDVAVFGATPKVYLGGPDGLSVSRVWQTALSGGSGTLLLEPQVDINGDGFTDLSSLKGVSVAGEPYPDWGAHIQFGASDGFAWAEAFVDVSHGGYTGAGLGNPIGLGDVDGDGFGDLVMQSDGDAPVIRGCAPAPPSAVWADLACGDDCRLPQVATGDFDGDGRTDVIFADEGEISLYQGNPHALTPLSVPGMTGLWVVDFNYDGYSDLVIKDPWPADTLRAYEGGPNGLSPTLSGETQPTSFVLLADFDGDGYWDLIGPDCTDACPTVASVWYGGTSGWGPPYARTTPLDRSIDGSYAIVVDLNADGYDDLLILGSDGISWYAGSPNGLATAPTVIVRP